MQAIVGTTRISAEQGDLTALDVDVIVNAANEHLRHGGGLAAAIVRAGGPAIQEESDRWVAEHGALSPGSAATTSSGNLPCRAVVHVAGPLYQEAEDNDGLLRIAARAALDATVHGGHRSVAVPAISAGIYGYPVRDATRLIASEAVAWAAQHPGMLDEVRLVGFNSEIADAFAMALADAL